MAWRHRGGTLVDPPTLELNLVEEVAELDLLGHMLCFYFIDVLDIAEVGELERIKKSFYYFFRLLRKILIFVVV